MTRSQLDDLVARRNVGDSSGMTSICSAHLLVLDESIRHAAEHGLVALIEATCNQVNQDGGYTGMQPYEFRATAQRLAQSHGLSETALVLGGDHLGPNPWKHLSAETAMAKSEELVATYVAAGFTKIHLDTSMRCADDAVGALHPAVISERSARLAATAERVASEVGVEVRYVIGTEVPTPGGESSGEHGIHVTTPSDLAETIELTQLAFARAGIESAWHRVRAIVAQPGVEFSDAELFIYNPEAARHLAGYAARLSAVVLEAHSTDYQPLSALRSLVDDGFAILKVGPELTFAYREAIFGLAYVEAALLGPDASQVATVLDRAMLADPSHWQTFYSKDDARAAFARKWSRSDRSRYYWPVKEVAGAVDILMENLRSRPIPVELLSQFLPRDRDDMTIESGDVRLEPEAVLRAGIRRVLDRYRLATTT